MGAANAIRQMGINQTNAGKSMEKLSSGLRINRAGDDAAGLAISEKMRGQIRGLDQASSNAQDGISLIQTAEGALNETHSILQRMRELAVQSGNDTNVSVDRNEIQKEADQLSQELSRVGNTTEFNTQNLLNGDFKATFQIGANESQNLKLSVGDMRGFALGMAGDAEVAVKATTTTPLAAGEYTVGGDLTNGLTLTDSKGVKVAQSADGLDWKDVSATPATMFTFDEAVTRGTVKSDGTDTTAAANIANTGLEAGDYKLNFVAGKSTLTDSNGTVVAASTDDTSFKNADGVEVLKLSTAALASTTIEVGGIDVSTQSGADSAITKIQKAIETVSSERSKLEVGS